MHKRLVESTPNFDRLTEKLRNGVLKQLDVLDQVVVVGGGALAAKGIRDCHDLDVICLPYAWELLKALKEEAEKRAEGRVVLALVDFDEINWEELEAQDELPYEGNKMGGISEYIKLDDDIDAFDSMDTPFFAGRCKKDPFEVMSHSVELNGLRFQGLNCLFDMKRGMGRPKDLDDIKLINQYMRLDCSNYSGT